LIFGFFKKFHYRIRIFRIFREGNPFHKEQLGKIQPARILICKLSKGIGKIFPGFLILKIAKNPRKLLKYFY